MEDKEFLKRLKEYDKQHCWQYDIRINNLEEDLKLLPSSVDYTKLTVDDFEFQHITNDSDKLEAVYFIKRHEWLGNIAMYTTHYFGAYYKGILAGVIAMSVPNSFSKMVGDKTKDIERLISRGACISWSPKCLASHFMMWCIKWMVKNTQFRIFSAYSDPTARELGTIYQSCNFYYLGGDYGGSVKYISPYTGKLISDRAFRQRSFYKKYAIELGISWNKTWDMNGKIDWNLVPDDIEEQLRKKSREKQNSSKCITVPGKHKYVYVLGRTKKETEQLRKEFLSQNKTYDYPKNRNINLKETHIEDIEIKESIEKENLF